MRIRQGVQQDGVSGGKNREVRADGQRESKDRNNRKSRSFEELPNREARVSKPSYPRSMSRFPWFGRKSRVIFLKRAWRMIDGYEAMYAIRKGHQIILALPRVHQWRGSKHTWLAKRLLRSQNFPGRPDLPG